MSRRLPSLRPAEVIRVLERNGFFADYRTEKTSHLYRRPPHRGRPISQSRPETEDFAVDHSPGWLVAGRVCRKDVANGAG